MIIPANPGYTMIPLYDLHDVWGAGDEQSIIAWNMVGDMDCFTATPITVLGSPEADFLVIDPLGNVSNPQEGTSFTSVSEAIDTLNRGE